MIRAAGQEVELRRQSKAGTSKRAYLKQAAKSRGREPQEEEVWIPEEGARIWLLYWRLRKGQSISYQEIEAFQRVTGYELESWEVEIVVKIDASVENAIAEGARKQ